MSEPLHCTSRRARLFRPHTFINSTNEIISGYGAKQGVLGEEMFAGPNSALGAHDPYGKSIHPRGFGGPDARKGDEAELYGEVNPQGGGVLAISFPVTGVG